MWIPPRQGREDIKDTGKINKIARLHLFIIKSNNTTIPQVNQVIELIMVWKTWRVYVLQKKSTEIFSRNEPCVTVTLLFKP